MTAPTTVTPLATYRNASPYPFCPGCGHHLVLDHLNRALVSLAYPPSRVVLVSDIGCSGLSDQYFVTSAFHGLHGRSITYATGIKLARPELKVIVIMGDGGTGIGGAHLLAAARRNIGLTVLVLNNFNFGMTGGQHSATTPPGARTATTPGGSLERPLDICATVAVNGASYVRRATSFDKDLSLHIMEAVRTDGFALLDIWDLCSAYFVPGNQASKRTLSTMMTELDLPSGVIARRAAPEFTAAYRASVAGAAERPEPLVRPIETRFGASLDRTFRLVVAGSAGGKVRSSARLVAEAAVACGLWATQRDDYPITVKTGHSIAELVIAPRPIGYTAIDRPDAMILLSDDGAAKVGRQLSAMEPADRVFVLPGISAKTRATITEIDPARSRIRLGAARLALYAIAHALGELSLLPVEALEHAAGLRNASRAAEAVETLRAAR